MQLFIDNWSTPLLASASAGALTLSVSPARAALLTGLGGGDYYELTLALTNIEGVEAAWEVVRVTAAASGTLTVTRGDTPLSWPAGTVVSARLTAAAVERLRSGGGGATAVVVGDDYPLEAPPSAGALYLYDSMVYLALGAEDVEDWVQLLGPGEFFGGSIGTTLQTLSVPPMARALRFQAVDAVGPTAPLTTLTMPAWRRTPHGMSISIEGVQPGVEIRLNIDCGAACPEPGTAEFFITDGAAGVSATFNPDDNILELSITSSVELVFSSMFVNPAGGIYAELTVRPWVAMVPVPVPT